MKAYKILPVVLSIAVGSLLLSRASLTGGVDSGESQSPLAPRHESVLQKIGPRNMDRPEPRVAPRPDEPPFRLSPPIPCREMSDTQLGVWIGYLESKEQQYSRLAKTYASLSSALRATHGGGRPGNRRIEGERTALTAYLERRLGKPLDLDNLNSVECSQVALTLEDLVGFIRERRDGALAEQDTRRK